jgi:AraC family transcriptional regulator of adaptative response/methylated-DNA-[protein]-cysteine methyltransferase
MMHVRFITGVSVLGTVLVAFSQHGLCALFLGDDSASLINALQQTLPDQPLELDESLSSLLHEQVIPFVESPATRHLDVVMDIKGTPFQQRVWQQLCTIRPGETLSYQELASRIGSPKAVRAVAGACAANKLAVIIPCHRVLRTNGDISGYRWGVERKRWLLEKEA